MRKSRPEWRTAFAGIVDCRRRRSRNLTHLPEAQCLAANPRSASRPPKEHNITLEKSSWISPRARPSSDGIEHNKVHSFVSMRGTQAKMSKPPGGRWLWRMCQLARGNMIPIFLDRALAAIYGDSQCFIPFDSENIFLILLPST
jgi:hypothetical protein